MAQFSYLVGFIGSGIGRSLGLELHEREAQRHGGLRYLCRRVNADAPAFRGRSTGELLRTCRNFGFSGLDIAHPFRTRVVPFVNELSETAARVGSVDFIVFTPDGRAIGHNTDVAGCVASFVRGLPEVPLDRVVQIGAGAAGIAAAHALRERGVRHISVTDPTPSRAEALAERLNQGTGPDWAEAFPVDALASRLKQADGLVHTLTPGSRGFRDTALCESLHPGLWIFDAHQHHAISTPLLRAGSELGCRVLHGGGVLVHETAAAFRLVTGLAPHTSRMFGDFADLTAGPLAHT
ncbi:shikimate dehydrogenase [Streptomyces phaeolivaceus]|uniref:shikimate dehydrogenase n=1 Tax=Streptomyces phaeolivaceus TaxID=2653200 RepID=UPI001869E3B8|nr:shikimate dehydrogenase [Streptomyces phaeolivaceus]